MLTKTNGVLLSLLLCGASALAQSATAVLTIHADQTASKVSPTLYGLMTEEINHAYEGGLYAEMVSDNTFHADWSGILDWYLLENGNSAAKMSIDKTTGPSQALNSSLRLDVTAASESAQAGVLNTGYWGMVLHANTTYR
ncbi:MAG: alpha-N-arabinofuranosidase, partial [Acidobacteriaceae bacterium]